MKLKTNKLSAWLAALAFVLLAPMAQATQFVTDGEFSYPVSFNPSWIKDGVVDPDFSEGRPGGTPSSAFFQYDAGSKLSQFIGGLKDLTYNIEFYLKFEELTGFTAAVTDALDNSDPVQLPVPDIDLLGLAFETVSDGWVRYYGTFSGIDGFNLTFSYNGAEVDGVLLDGVSITQVPEPGSLALMGLALAGIAVLRRRKA